MTVARSVQPGAQPPHPAAPDAQPPILQAEGLVKRFRIDRAHTTAVADIDLAVRRGEFVAIMGASGSGKSTLLHLLGGLETPTQGRVRFDGSDLGTLSDRQRTLLRRRRIGFVFQFFNLLPTLTVRENILLPLLIDGKRPADFQRMLTILARLFHLEEVLGQRPHQLSGGQQQQVAIARALLFEPDVILADEPTGNLDHASGLDLLEHLWSSCAHLGRTVVIVTHEAKSANYADRVIVLRDGMAIAEILLGRDRPRNDARTLVTRLQDLGL